MPSQSAIRENDSQTAEVTIPVQRTRYPERGADQARSDSHTYSVAVSQPVEPEDAYLTGVSRSLQRRLLGLNVSSTRMQKPEVNAARGAVSGAARAEARSEKKLKSA